MLCSTGEVVFIHSDQVDKTCHITLIFASSHGLTSWVHHGDIMNIYPELALYVSKNECARTDTVLFAISQVCTRGWNFYHLDICFSRLYFTEPNRPGVTGLLYKHLCYCIKSVGHAFFKYLQNTFTPKLYELRTWCLKKFHLCPCVTYQMSHVTYHMSHVTCLESHITFILFTEWTLWANHPPPQKKILTSLYCEDF